jgi:hypothetical protein
MLRGKGSEGLREKPLMPKERFHLLVADECFKVLKTSGPKVLYDDGDMREAYLLGSIMPDTLFYDAPYFSFSPHGKRLHKLEGEPGLEFFHEWLDEEGERIPKEVQFWILGLATHYLTDGFWHPVITKYSTPHSWLCRNLRFSSKSCHYWMESQMEAYWLPHLSPPDGYCDMLKTLQGRRTEYNKYFQYYRKLIRRAGLRKLPSAARIRRCLFWQTTALQFFAHPKCAEWKPRLLAARDFGKSLSALIVPRHPAPPFLEACRLQQVLGDKNPCDGRLLAQTIVHLTSRLQTLPVRI